MGVVDDHDLARDGQGAAHGPVVAADLEQLLFGGRFCLAIRGDQARIRFHEFELRQAAGNQRISFSFPHRGHDIFVDDGHVQALRHHEIIPGQGRHVSIGLLDAQLRHGTGQPDLVPGVVARAREEQAGPAPHHRLLRPPAGLDARQLELHRQVVGVRVDIGVHAVRVGREDALALGVVAGPFPFVEGSAVHHEPRPGVVVEGLGAEDLRETAFPPPAPELHLPQAVLGHHITLGKEEIIRILRVDVGYAVAVPDHLDGFLQSFQGQFPFDLGEGCAGKGHQLFVGIDGVHLLAAASGQQGNYNEHDNKMHGFGKRHGWLLPLSAAELLSSYRGTNLKVTYNR